jgi:hypothetical protein
MKEFAAVTLSAFVGGVSYFLTLGFVLPPGAEGFKFFATLGAISGFGLGSVLARRAKSYGLLALGFLGVLNLVVGFAAALGYMLMTALGVISGPYIFFALASLLLLSFFCLGLALPLAGLSFSG